MNASSSRTGFLAARWNPYVVGAAIGVLSMLAFFWADKPLGVSTALAQCAGACASPVIGAEAVAANPYWAQKAPPKWDYSALFVAGMAAGAFLSALTSGSWKVLAVPSVWRARFGPSVALRMAVAFVGGFVILFGARLADGCTSGHGISGSMQLAVSSWVFFLVLFASGVATTALLFRRR